MSAVHDPGPKRSDRFYTSIDPTKDPDKELTDEVALLNDADTDSDRILLAPEFHRLGGITQVISPLGHVPTHNRLTHSLEVANIGKRIAHRLLNLTEPDYPALIQQGGGLDVGTVEAACLAHDLGHPPYGHVVEYALAREMEQIFRDSRDPIDGFEGNAQSFRIVTNLSARIPGFKGLGLTRATLAAIQKYPWSREHMPSSKKDHPKWGYYQEDEQHFTWARAHLPTTIREYDPNSSQREYRTIEAQIMDLADDIAYSTHDLIDFLRLGAIPIEAFEIDSEEFKQAFANCSEKNKWTKEAQKVANGHLQQALLLVPKKRISEQGPQDLVTLRQYGATRIANCVNATSLRSKRVPELVDSGESNEEAAVTLLHIEESQKTQVEFFIAVVKTFVIDNRAMASQRIGQNTIVTKVFQDTFRLAQFDKSAIRGDQIQDLSRLVVSVAEGKEEAERRIRDGGRDAVRSVARQVTDWIAGMTEQELLGVYKRLDGHELGMPLDPISY